MMQMLGLIKQIPLLELPQTAKDIGCVMRQKSVPLVN